MPAELGQMQERLQIQSLVETTDQYGQPVQDWSEGITIWARVRPASGREITNADQLKVAVSHVVTTRYREGIRAEQQFLWRDRPLRITYILPDESRTMMDLYCVEQPGEDDES